MLFYESGGKAYGVFQDSRELVPKVGFHIPGKMGGVWFGALRVISSLKVEGFGKVLNVIYEDSGRKVKFEEGEAELLIPWMEESLFLKLRGNGRLEMKLDSTPSWKSEEVVKSFVPTVESNSRMRILGNFIEIPVLKETLVCISKGKCNPREFEKKKIEKRSRILEKVPEGRGSLEGALKTFLLEMYLKTENGEGLMAGLEEFPWWFSIDTSLMAPTLLRIGFSKILKMTLKTLLNKGKDIPPHEVINSGVVNNVFNEVELFSILYSVLLYTRCTGDTSLLDISQHYFETAKRLLRSGFPHGRGMVELKSEENLHLDVSCWAFAFLKELSEISKKFKRLQDSFFDNSLSFFENRFVKFWYDEKRKLFRDSSGEIHFTQIMPLYFKLVPREIALDVVQKLKDIGMITHKGLKHSLKRTEKEGFYGVKSEKVWWIANHLLIESASNYNLEVPYNLIELFHRDLEKFKTPPELVGGGGCFAQSWSALVGIRKNF